MLALRLPEEIERRLAALAKRTGRSKSFYAREAILEHLDDLEAEYLSDQVLKRVQDGQEQTYTLDELELRIVADFLPSPENLVFKEENVKVTITLSKSSVDFFKKAAKKHHTQYQKMIRRLLDQYTTHHSNNL